MGQVLLVPSDANNKDKFGLSLNIKVPFFPRKTFQADLLTFSILVFLDIGLGTLEDDLALSLGSLNSPQLANGPTKYIDCRKTTQRCMTQSRKMVFDRLHRPQTRLLLCDMGRYHQHAVMRPFFFNHRHTFFFSARAASRSAWVFSCVLRFLSSDSGMKTWSFVGTVLLA